MLEGAAVAGDPFEPELVAAAAGVDTSGGGRGARRAAAQRSRPSHRCAAPLSLPAPARPPRGLRSLARRLAYRRAPAKRRGARRRAARRRRRARTTSSAPRTHGDNAAVAVLRAAGDEAAQRTPAGAARWFGGGPAAARRGRAGRGTRRAADGARRGTEAATGQFAEARAALLQSIELLPDDPGRAGRV